MAAVPCQNIRFGVVRFGGNVTACFSDGRQQLAGDPFLQRQGLGFVRPTEEKVQPFLRNQKFRLSSRRGIVRQYPLPFLRYVGYTGVTLPCFPDCGCNVLGDKPHLVTFLQSCPDPAGLKMWAIDSTPDNPVCWGFQWQRPPSSLSQFGYRTEGEGRYH